MLNTPLPFIDRSSQRDLARLVNEANQLLPENLRTEFITAMAHAIEKNNGQRPSAFLKMAHSGMALEY